jgi:hypothetical protein
MLVTGLNPCNAWLAILRQQQSVHGIPKHASRVSTF